LAPYEEMTASDAFHLLDPYSRGASVMHTLRYHLGDDLFFELLKRWAYPDPDDLGNEDGRQCRLVDTEDMKVQAEEVTGIELDPFFSVFFREAAFPQLLVNREYNQTTFEWVTEQNVPLDLNVPVLNNEEEFTVEMENGVGCIAMNINDDLVIDPNEWILMQDPDIILNTDQLNHNDIENQLMQNFPNPFSESTLIFYSISSNQNVSIILYDYMGNEIQVLVDGFHQKGDHSIEFNRTELANGIYFYKMNSENEQITRKLQIVE
jgi:hypothetical protein